MDHSDKSARRDGDTARHTCTKDTVCLSFGTHKQHYSSPSYSHSHYSPSLYSFSSSHSPHSCPPPPPPPHHNSCPFSASANVPSGGAIHACRHHHQDRSGGAPAIAITVGGARLPAPIAHCLPLPATLALPAPPTPRPLPAAIHVAAGAAVPATAAVTSDLVFSIAPLGRFVMASRFRTNLCRNYVLHLEETKARLAEEVEQRLLTKEGTADNWEKNYKNINTTRRAANFDLVDSDDSFVSVFVCPYGSRCLFAHSEAKLRTTAMNIADGLTTEEAIRTFTRLEAFATKESDHAAEKKQTKGCFTQDGRGVGNNEKGHEAHDHRNNGSGHSSSSGTCMMMMMIATEGRTNANSHSTNKAAARLLPVHDDGVSPKAEQSDVHRLRMRRAATAATFPLLLYSPNAPSSLRDTPAPIIAIVPSPSSSASPSSHDHRSFNNSRNAPPSPLPKASGTSATETTTTTVIHTHLLPTTGDHNNQHHYHQHEYHQHQFNDETNIFIFNDNCNAAGKISSRSMLGETEPLSITARGAANDASTAPPPRPSSACNDGGSRRPLRALLPPHPPSPLLPTRTLSLAFVPSPLCCDQRCRASSPSPPLTFIKNDSQRQSSLLAGAVNTPTPRADVPLLHRLPNRVNSMGQGNTGNSQRFLQPPPSPPPPSPSSIINVSFSFGCAAQQYNNPPVAAPAKGGPPLPRRQHNPYAPW